MASEATLAIRSQKNLEKDARRAERQAQEQMAQARQQSAATVSFITNLARDIYAKNVRPLVNPKDSPEQLYSYYEAQSHAAMDAAIAFVRSSNSYTDASKVPQNAPALVAENVDANGTPILPEPPAPTQDGGAA